MGAGARELGVSGAGAGAPSDASAPDQTSGRLQVQLNIVYRLQTNVHFPTNKNNA
jgi:hypothetical protein